MLRKASAYESQNTYMAHGQQDDIREEPLLEEEINTKEQSRSKTMHFIQKLTGGYNTKKTDEQNSPIVSNRFDSFAPEELKEEEALLSY